jgi:hypothetical protein
MNDAVSEIWKKDNCEIWKEQDYEMLHDQGEMYLCQEEKLEKLEGKMRREYDDKISLTGNRASFICNIL